MDNPAFVGTHGFQYLTASCSDRLVRHAARHLAQLLFAAGAVIFVATGKASARTDQ